MPRGNQLFSFKYAKGLWQPSVTFIDGSNTVNHRNLQHKDSGIFSQDTPSYESDNEAPCYDVSYSSGGCREIPGAPCTNGGSKELPPSSHTSCSDGDSSGIEIRDEDRTNGQSEFHLGEGGIHPPPPLVFSL